MRGLSGLAWALKPPLVLWGWPGQPAHSMQLRALLNALPAAPGRACSTCIIIIGCSIIARRPP
jgi:hypothetical protein